MCFFASYPHIISSTENPQKPWLLGKLFVLFLLRMGCFSFLWELKYKLAVIKLRVTLFMLIHILLNYNKSPLASGAVQFLMENHREISNYRKSELCTKNQEKHQYWEYYYQELFMSWSWFSNFHSILFNKESTTECKFLNKRQNSTWMISSVMILVPCLWFRFLWGKESK